MTFQFLVHCNAYLNWYLYEASGCVQALTYKVSEGIFCENNPNELADRRINQLVSGVT